MRVAVTSTADRDFAVGLALGYQWADTVNDSATRERFIDAAVIHVLPSPSTDSGDERKPGMLLAASILGVRCDDDAASAFWSMVAPGVEVNDLSHWFFEGFVYGATEVFSKAPDDEYGELRKLIPHPPPPP